MQLVKRTVGVLRSLVRHPQGAGLQDIANDLEIPLSTTHRLLGVLVAEEFVVRDDRTYRLGPEALRLSSATPPLHEIARPHLTRLSADTGETVFLAELVNDRVLCTAMAPGSHALRLFVHVGQDLPLNAAAGARAILAHRSPEEARRLLTEAALTSFTADTPNSPDAVLDVLATVRERGYDVCDGELDANVVAVGAAIRTAQGITASLTVAAPPERLQPGWTADLVRAADQISTELGQPPLGDARKTDPTTTPTAPTTRTAPTRLTGPRHAH